MLFEESFQRKNQRKCSVESCKLKLNKVSFYANIKNKRRQISQEMEMNILFLVQYFFFLCSVMVL